MNRKYSKEIQMAKNYKKKMFDYFTHLENANQDYIEIPSHHRQNGYYQIKMLAKMQGEVNPQILLLECKLVSHYGKQYRGSSEN